MAVELNHTIVWSANQNEAARFLCEILGLAPPRRFAHFAVVELANGVSLDFADGEVPIAPQHYAFLVSDEEFTAIMARIAERGLMHWADPARRQPGQTNHRDGGQGVYFEGPDGHFYEALTRPYGSGAQA